jgi:hypothetical protein
MPLIALLLLLAAAPAAAAQRPDFEWKGVVAAGKAVEIVGVNGSIRAGGGSAREVEVRATKRGRRSDPDEVMIEVVEHAGGVTVCAVYPARRAGRENECLPGGKGRNETRDNDVNVEFTVAVPASVRFIGRTVNGSVEAEGLSETVEARTVNGSVKIDTRSWATASTVNGSIRARLGRTDWPGEAEFETVNGGISLELPASTSADVSASTVNGSIETDFPLTIQGRWGPRRLNGTIGQGGRRLALSTVNGDMTLRRAP